MPRKKPAKNPPFAMLRQDILNSPAYTRLSHPARSLLVELIRQHRPGSKGRPGNNGDLTAAWSLMQARGFVSKGTLHRSLAELLESGLIERTRQGGRNRCSLYALTWFAIDDCRDKNGCSKLDVKPTSAPSNAWRQWRAKK